VTQESGPRDFTFADVIRSKIERWLGEEGWTFLPTQGAELIWAVVARDRLGRAFVIAQHAGHHDRVVIEARIVPSNEQLEKLRGAPEDVEMQLVWTLRRELLQLGVDFRSLTRPLARIILTEAIYFEGALDGALAKDTFFMRIEQVRRGIQLVQLVLQRDLANR
jgi:hypothetical protein